MGTKFQKAINVVLPALEAMKKNNLHLTAHPESVEALRQAQVLASQPSVKISAETPLQKSIVGTSEEKTALLEKLRPSVLACTQCAHLVACRHNVVFGIGNPQARLMFVGEAPGADEDAKGEPFVGRAGQTLTKIIQAMGLSRSEVYIANILKCRPNMPEGESGNRKPVPAEMATCLPWLLQQIEIIKPEVMVALGSTAVQGLTGNETPIGRLRSHWLDFRGIPLMPTYHPAYLLHNSSNTEKRKVWEDMLQVLEKLAMPISEKQRAFFK